MGRYSPLGWCIIISANWYVARLEPLTKVVLPNASYEYRATMVPLLFNISRTLPK